MKAKKIECYHDTAGRLMIFEFGDRVQVVVNFETGTISFFRDGEKYGEMNGEITIAEFEQILLRTEQEVLQLNKRG
jgi:hypothetical protein